MPSVGKNAAPRKGSGSQRRAQSEFHQVGVVFRRNWRGRVLTRFVGGEELEKTSEEFLEVGKRFVGIGGFGRGLDAAHGKLYALRRGLEAPKIEIEIRFGREVS